jgi:hypothetical protein
MRHLAIALLLAPSVAAACAPVVPPKIEPPHVTAPPAMVPPVPPPRLDVVAADDDDVREAVFRHLFDHNASGQQQAAKVFCLQIEGKQDPSTELLRRFEGNEPRVKKVSLCTFQHGQPRSGVVDASGAPGLIFRIDAIQHPTADSAVVEGGYFEAGLSSSGNVYELVKEGDRWIVKKDTMRWIS